MKLGEGQIGLSPLPYGFKMSNRYTLSTRYPKNTAGTYGLSSINIMYISVGRGFLRAGAGVLPARVRAAAQPRGDAQVDTRARAAHSAIWRWQLSAARERG